MRIIIAGCGKIGTTIVASLVAEGHDVIAVDNDTAVVEELTNNYDVMAVCETVRTTIRCPRPARRDVIFLSL